VHVSVSHDEEFARVHFPSAVWVQAVSTRGFEACARETGPGRNGTGIISWFAFQDQAKITHGSITFKGKWTTETKCEKVTFKKVSNSFYPNLKTYAPRSSCLQFRLFTE